MVLGAWNAINLNGGCQRDARHLNGNGGVTELNHLHGEICWPNLGIYAAPLQPVPLPPAIALLGSGLLSLFGFGRRKKSA